MMQSGAKIRKYFELQILAAWLYPAENPTFFLFKMYCSILKFLTILFFKFILFALSIIIILKDLNLIKDANLSLFHNRTRDHKKLNSYQDKKSKIEL